MAATNIFYRIPSQRGTRVASIAGTVCTLDQFCNYIIDIEGLNRQDFIIASGTKVFRPSSCSLQSINLQNNSNVDILIPLLGGKGGFGSLLRAIGAQIEKTTNRDACRDLSGRRLRDIKREDELRKLLELQEKLKEERKRRRAAKLEKLKKNSETSETSASIQELVAIFDDHAFNKRRLELGDIIDAAVEKGLINSKRRQTSVTNSNIDRESRKEMFQAEPGNCFDSKEPHKIVEQDRPETNNISNSNCDKKEPSPTLNISKDSKSPTRATTRKNTRKEDLWLGLEEDDEVDSGEEEDGRVASVVLK